MAASVAIPCPPSQSGQELTVIPKQTKDTIEQMLSTIRRQDLLIKALRKHIEDLEDKQMKCYRCRVLSRQEQE